MSAPGVPRFLPWQQGTARAWLGERSRLAHAWLIHGAAGAGQVEFAEAGAASLLCEAPELGLACGRCLACGWAAAGNHPDLRRIRPDALAQAEAGPGAEAGEGKRAPSREIRVEQVRALLPWFNTATHRGGLRVALLYPAQALNAISANALLKILEEPPAHTVFLLACDAPDRLLPTLVSRCRRLPLALPEPAQARDWLQAQGVADAAQWLAACGGAPLRALARARQGGDPVPAWLDALLALCEHNGQAAELADALLQEDTAEWIDACQRLVFDLWLATGGGAPRYHPGLQPRLQALAGRLDPSALAELSRWLLRQRRLAGHVLNARFLADHAVTLLVGACRPATPPPAR